MERCEVDYPSLKTSARAGGSERRLGLDRLFQEEQREGTGDRPVFLERQGFFWLRASMLRLAAPWDSGAAHGER